MLQYYLDAITKDVVIALDIPSQTSFPYAAIDLHEDQLYEIPAQLATRLDPDFVYFIQRCFDKPPIKGYNRGDPPRERKQTA